MQAFAFGRRMKYNYCMKKKFLPCGAIILTCAAVFCGCGQSVNNFNLPSWSEYRLSGSTALQGTYPVMGTEATARFADADNFADENTYSRAVSLWGDIRAILDKANSSLSATVTSSYIYKFNSASAGEKVEIDKTCFDVLTTAVSVYEKTGGYYNPAVYQSVRLYGFGDGVTTPDSLPDNSDVEAYRQLSTHFNELELFQEDGKYYAVKPQFTVTAEGQTQSLKIDLGGIGKGWCADRVREMTSSAGFEYGFFSFGSSSISLHEYLSNQDHTYNLSSRDPRGSGGYCSVRVKNTCVSTSADYEQYYILDGVRYCHIIDPTTGSPIAKGVASATVIGGSAAENDALSTALCAMDKNTAVEFINGELSDRTVIMLVFEDGQGKVITNRTDKIEITNSAYTLANRVEDGKIVLN